MSELVSIVPKGLIGLDLKLFSKIFEHFIEMRDFTSFKEALDTFPVFVIN